MSIQAELVLSPDPPPSRAGPQPVLAVSLFGATRAVDISGQPVLPRARKTRALLAILAMHAPRPVLRLQLTAMLWSRREPEQARASLRQARHELQAALGPRCASLLIADRHQLALSDRGLWTDVGALARAGADQPDALELYRPHLLADLSGVAPELDRWIATEAARLGRLARALARAVLDAGDRPAAMVAAAEHLLAHDPTDASAWDALIAALMRSGDRAGAAEAELRRRIALTPPSGPPPTASPGSATLTPDPAWEAAFAMPDGPSLTAWAAEAAAPGPSAPPHDPPPDPRVQEDAGGAARATWTGNATARGLRIGVIGLRALPGGAARDQAAALAAGLSEELVAALAGFRGIACIPLGVVGMLAGGLAEAPDWRDADLDLLLDGVIQSNGAQVRVRVRLLDFAAGGDVVWATRFDRPFDDLLALQDELAGETVAQLESQLLRWEGTRGRHGTDPIAQRLLRAAVPGLLRLDRRAFMRAGRLLEAARQLDPEDASVHTWLAYWHLFAVGQGWTDDAPAARRLVRRLADTAVALDPGDARALALAAHVRGFVDRDPVAAESLHARAADANPNLPLGWSLSGLNLAYRGCQDEAIRRSGLARRLSPQEPLGYFFDTALAVPHLLRGENAIAVQFGSAAIAANPEFSFADETQLAALGHLGRREEAAEVRDRLLTLEPGFSVSQALEGAPIQDPEGRARYAEGLRLGGLT